MTMYQPPMQTSLQKEEPKEDRSLGELLGHLTQDIVTLVRQEVTLARTEMSQKFASITKNLGMLAAGGALAYAGVLTVVASLVLLLIHLGVPAWIAALVVGLIVTGIGGALVMKGINAMRQADLTPRQTLDSLKELKHG